MRAPWLNDATSPNGRRVRENFKRWFANSQVIDKDGIPLVVYHATWREFDGDGFKWEHNQLSRIYQSLGFHFGTARAANDRIRSPLRRLENYPHRAAKDGIQPLIIPVYLSIQRPLSLPDVGAWHQPWAVAPALMDAGIHLDNHVQYLDGSLLRRDGLQKLIKLLLAAGHDGIVYKNKKEHKGSMSYIAFSPGQIKSALGNSGLYLKTGLSLTDHAEALALHRAMLAKQSLAIQKKRDKVLETIAP